MSSASLTPEEFSYLVRHDTFQAAMIEVLMVGVYTSIVLFTIHNIVSRRGFKASLRPLILMLVMYFSTVVHLALYWKSVKYAFVDNGQSEDAVLGAISHSTVAEIVIITLSRGLAILTGDAIMIWRCWNLYARSWLVVTMPILLLLGELAFLLGRTYYKVQVRFSALSSDITVKMGIAHASFTLATTVLVTLLIVYRIVRMGGAKRYHNTIEIIVESSALYAIAVIIYLPFTLHPVMLNVIPNAVLTPMPGITSTLIIARVSLGKGIEKTWEGDNTHTRTGRQISTLGFRTTHLSSQHDEESGLGPNIGSSMEESEPTRDGTQSDEKTPSSLVRQD